MRRQLTFEDVFSGNDGVHVVASWPFKYRVVPPQQIHARHSHGPVIGVRVAAPLLSLLRRDVLRLKLFGTELRAEGTADGLIDSENGLRPLEWCGLPGFERRIVDVKSHRGMVSE